MSAVISHGGNRWRDKGKPRNYRTDRRCILKRYFSDELLARAAGQDTILTEGLKKLWVYRCPHCPGWHLTSNNQGANRLITAVSPA